MRNEGAALSYVILRAVPDLLRGEMLNVALVAVCNGRLFTRVAGPSRCITSMLSDPDLERLSGLEKTLVSHFADGFPSYDCDGRYTLSPIPDVGFLRYLETDGYGGYLIEPIREERVAFALEPAIRAAFEDLFERLISPRPLAMVKAKPHKSRAKTHVLNFLKNVDYSGQKVARNLTVANAQSQATYDITFAFANGKPVFGQAVDFDTRPETQELNTERAIANIAEVAELLGSKRPGWLNVVYNGASEQGNLSSLLQRLVNFGHIIQLPRDQDYFEKLLNDKATSDVRKSLEARFVVKEVDSHLCLIVDPSHQKSLELEPA